MKNYYYIPYFVSQNTQKSDMEGHIFIIPHNWKGMQRTVFMFNPLSQSKNSNHNFFNTWPTNISNTLCGKKVKSS